MDPKPLIDLLQPLLADLVRLAWAVAPAVLLPMLVFVLLRRAYARRGLDVQRSLLGSARGPVLWLLPMLAVQVVLPGLPSLAGRPELLASVRHALALAVITGMVWLGVRLLRSGAELIRSRHDLAAEDNLEARRVHTQITVLARTLMSVVVVLGVAAALMTFPRVREIGGSLLVSAGFAGLAVGLAARPVLENLIAGLQLAFTQPIRIDDVVIVEGEWGWIEEITATYVVVRIWDQRRLVVPFAKFITEPFQNWTRRSSDILGTVFLHVDYRTPVDAVREELKRLCAAHPKWDRRTCVLQVTEARERTLELRALVSARNSPDAWDLRVDLREALVAFLQREHPDCLPRTRVSLEPAADADPVTGAGSA